MTESMSREIVHGNQYDSKSAVLQREILNIDLTLEQLTSGICKSATIKGDIVTKEGFRVDGKIDGSVTASTVVIAPQALVKGNVVGKRVFVWGRVEGSIQANEILVLADTAVVEGDVAYSEIISYRGHKINGRVRTLDTAAKL